MIRSEVVRWSRRAVLTAGAIALGGAVARRLGLGIDRSGDVSRAGRTTRLHVSATPATHVHMFRALAAAFERRNPNTQILLDVTQSDQPALLQETLRAALVGRLPDISFQGYEFLRLLRRRGIAVPLDEYLGEDSELRERPISPLSQALGRAEDKLAGLGFTMSFPILVYNERLVAEAGEAVLSKVSTWEEVLRIAARIQSRTPGVLGAYTRYNPFVFQGLLKSQSGRLMTADESRLMFDDEIGLSAFHLLRGFGLAGQARVDMTRSQVRQAFANGRIGILVDSSSSLMGYEQSTGSHLRVGTARVPLSGSAPRIPASGTAAVLMTRDKERAHAAWRFIKFAVSAEGQAIVSEMTSYVPANLQPANAALCERCESSAAPAAALQSVPYATALYAFPGDNALEIDRLLEDCLSDVVTLRKAPEHAVRRLKANIQPLLPDSRLS